MFVNISGVLLVPTLVFAASNYGIKADIASLLGDPSLSSKITLKYLFIGISLSIIGGIYTTYKVSTHHINPLRKVEPSIHKKMRSSNSILLILFSWLIFFILLTVWLETLEWATFMPT